MKIFIISLGRSGSTSTYQALKFLGFKGKKYSQNVLADSKVYPLLKIHLNVDSHEKLYETYGEEAKFIYNKRLNTDWLDSWETHHNKVYKKLPEWMKENRERRFGRRTFERSVWLSTKMKYEEELLSYFSDKPNQLLTLNIFDNSDEENWDILKEFTNTKHRPSRKHFIHVK